MRERMATVHPLFPKGEVSDQISFNNDTATAGALQLWISRQCVCADAATKNEHGAPRSKAARYLHFTQHLLGVITGVSQCAVSFGKRDVLDCSAEGAGFIVCRHSSPQQSCGVFWTNN